MIQTRSLACQLELGSTCPAMEKPVVMAVAAPSASCLQSACTTIHDAALVGMKRWTGWQDACKSHTRRRNGTPQGVASEAPEGPGNPKA